MVNAWIDTRGMALGQGTGVATYSRGLACTLDHLGIITDFLRLTPTGSPLSQPPPSTLTAIGCILKALSPFIQIRQDQAGHPFLPFMFRMANTHFKCFHRPLRLRTLSPPQIMHWSYPLPLKMDGSINISTIHDIIPLINTDMTGINNLKIKKIINSVISNMDYIITVTEHVRQQITEYFKIPEDRIHNLYQCAGVPAAELSQLPHADRIAPPDAFVSVGRVEKRKNIRRMIIAHARSQTRRPLVIIGPQGDDKPDLSPLHANQQIIRVPWCKRESLLRAIAEARALLFPSLAEGFGLPIIEAMSLNTPVMTSIGGATEEVAGNAALLVDPHDVEQMSQTIHALDIMDDQARARWIRAGQERARFFSLEAQALRMKNFYTRIGVL